MVEYIFSLVIMCVVAFIMIGIGNAQLKSETPVGFYSGEKPPRPEDVTDVKQWNRKHGIMWILYGVAMICAHLVIGFIWDSFWASVVLVGVVVGALPLMIWYHNKLKKEYFRENK